VYKAHKFFTFKEDQYAGITIGKKYLNMADITVPSTRQRYLAVFV
jgi:hypothetical protein